MRLIDADQFKAKLLSFMDRKSTTPSYNDCILDGVINLLEEQPTIEPIKHGHWIFKDNGNADCSCCGYRSSRVYDDDNADHYCRHCGAKMDGDDKC